VPIVLKSGILNLRVSPGLEWDCFTFTVLWSTWAKRETLANQQPEGYENFRKFIMGKYEVLTAMLIHVYILVVQNVGFWTVTEVSKYCIFYLYLLT
jgi:TRAP-type C4-dicarboxylate transport system permease large subunit